MSGVGVEVGLFVAGLLLALGFGWAVWGRALVAVRETANRATVELAQATLQAAEVPELRKELDSLRASREELVALKAAAEERERAQAAREAQLVQTGEALKAQFEQLAGETLRKNQQQFIEMATETFKVQREKADAGLQKNKAELAELITPMRDTLSRYEEQIKAIEVARAEAYGQLKSQIETVAQGQLAVRDEAARLVSALRSSGKTAGSWGEQQLRNVLEMAGLREGVDFSVQTSTDTDDGKRRPDAIIRLPGGRELIIDSKCSLNDYLSAGEADGEDARRAAYKRHALAVRAHAKGLGEKAYWNEFGKSADFVVMFLPGENFLSAALEHDLALLGWAFDQRILLAGPINLLAIAKTVALVWRQETLAEEAQRIGELGADLHAAIATMAEHVARVGGNLDSAVRAYDDFVGSLERNVLPKARRFTEMGVEKGKKQIAETKPVAKTTRTRLAPELIALPKGEAAE